MAQDLQNPAIPKVYEVVHASSTHRGDFARDYNTHHLEWNSDLMAIPPFPATHGRIGHQRSKIVAKGSCTSG